MREPPRRRRSRYEPSGGLPVFPLVVLVILSGLLLGGVMAHFFGNPGGLRRSATTVAVATLSPTPAMAETPALAGSKLAQMLPPTQAPTVAPSASPTAAPNPTLAPSPVLRPSPAHALSSAHAPSSAQATRLTHTATTVSSDTAEPQPTAARSAAVVTAKAPTLMRAASPSHHASLASAPTAAASTPPTGTRPADVVRSYLEALARGDRAAATSYLAHGFPSETFMSAGSQIEYIRAASVGPHEYQARADVQTDSGEYYVTFTLQRGPDGLEITDHYTIQPR